MANRYTDRSLTNVFELILYPTNSAYKYYSFEENISGSRLAELLMAYHTKSHHRCCYIVHDSDVWHEYDTEVKLGKYTAGEIKKEHIHFVFELSNKKELSSYVNAINQCFNIPIKHILGCDEFFERRLQYLLHIGYSEEEKNHYNVEDLVVSPMVDIEKCLNYKVVNKYEPTMDENEFLSLMLSKIDNNEFSSICQMINYGASLNNARYLKGYFYMLERYARSKGVCYVD